jgi:hypothetical protein
MVEGIDGGKECVLLLSGRRRRRRLKENPDWEEVSET